jgi:ATP-dependent protease HslVU (ClpYQ) peptidase subunit
MNLIEKFDGKGNVIEIDDVEGIGSDGFFAECAARAQIEVDGFDS